MFRFLFRLFLLGLAVTLAGAVYAFWPRTADLRGFDAAAVARLETAMWRDYYAKDYQALGKGLYSLYREEYHFSPADSAQLAYCAGKAAQVFQPTGSRAEAQAALPLLTRYYKIIRDRGGESFDPAKAAALELDWWQLRRESVAPAKYGEVVAQVTEEIFKVENEPVKKSAQLRAAMMRYRDDRRNGKMLPEDWTHIEKNLLAAYEALQEGVRRKP